MKNNQFKAHLTKYISTHYNKMHSIHLDVDSNTRRIYLYTELTQYCLGSIVLYFTNDYVNISYSDKSSKVCKLSNQREQKQFDYCELREAKIFIERAIMYFENEFLKRINKGE